MYTKTTNSYSLCVPEPQYSSLIKSAGLLFILDVLNINWETGSWQMELSMSHLLGHSCLSFILSVSDCTNQLISGPPGVSCPRARTHIWLGGTWWSGACRCVCRATGLEGEAQQVLITQSLTAHCMNLSTSDWCWHISGRFPTGMLHAACVCLLCQELLIVVARKKFLNFFGCKVCYSIESPCL